MFIQDSTLHYSMPTFNTSDYDRKFLTHGVIPGSFRTSYQASRPDPRIWPDRKKWSNSKIGPTWSGSETGRVGQHNCNERTVLFSSNHLYFRSWNMDGYVICQRKNGFYLRKSNVSFKNKILNDSYNYKAIINYNPE